MHHAIGRIRVYIATSLDGFIAGPDDSLDWLPQVDVEPNAQALGYVAFIAEIGAMVMGRRTYDVVRGLSDDWHYGDLPILVPTHRPLDPVRPSVTAIEGTIEEILDAALARAGGKDVYVDGGATIRAALDAGRVDELVITVVPVLLGEGIPLFTGLKQRRSLEVLSHVDYGGGLVQWRLRPSR